MRLFVKNIKSPLRPKIYAIPSQRTLRNIEKDDCCSFLPKILQVSVSSLERKLKAFLVCISEAYIWWRNSSDNHNLVEINSPPTHFWKLLRKVIYCIMKVKHEIPGCLQLFHTRVFQNFVLISNSVVVLILRYVMLEDCSHIFTYQSLDIWMGMDDIVESRGEAVDVQMKECPRCKTVVRRSRRYGRFINKQLKYV